jgi:murein DD-endopeptidase MepM/ murein hydrolase activator NlpD
MRKLDQRLYTFVISSGADRRIHRFSFRYPALISTAVFVAVVILAGSIGVYQYSRMLLRVADYNFILGQNNAFRAENQNYRIHTAQLGEKIDSLETTSRKLAILSGMERSAAVGGTGGVSADTMSKPLSPGSESLAAIDRYSRNVSDLEERLRLLKDAVYESAQVAAARPAFLPVNGYVTGGMGRREDPFTGSSVERHTGIDISAPYGTRVVAPADGTVIFAGTRAGYGNIVVIDHKFGVSTRYGHLWKFSVEAGQHVSRHDTIGYVGTTGRTTGPHLHFELRVHDRSIDPLRYIAQANRSRALPSASRSLP